VQSWKDLVYKSLFLSIRISLSLNKTATLTRPGIWRLGPGLKARLQNQCKRSLLVKVEGRDHKLTQNIYPLQTDTRAEVTKTPKLTERERQQTAILSHNNVIKGVFSIANPVFHQVPFNKLSEQAVLRNAGTEDFYLYQDS